MQQDEYLSKVVRIENRGTHDVTIENVLTSCGCTVANLKERFVPVGKSVEMEVRLNTSHRKGPVESPILIELKGETRKIKLSITANVIELYSIDKPSLRFSFTKGAASALETFKVFTEKWPELRFDPKAIGDGFSLKEIGRTTTTKGTNIEYEVTARAPEGDKDYRVERLTLKPAQALPSYKVVAYLYVADAGASFVKPTSRALGVITPGSQTDFRLFCDKSFVKQLVMVDEGKVEDGFQVRIAARDLEQGVLTIQFVVDKGVPPGLFQKWIVLRDGSGNRKSHIELLGEVREPGSRSARNP